MKKIGIICEYNPFHNGHLHHINTIKENNPDSMIILSLSSSFTQRGDLSILNKFDKAKIAIEYGVDLVLELPTIFSIQEASKFAYYHVLNLSRANVDEIWIGSESDNPDSYYEYLKLISNSEFKQTQKVLLDEGYSLKSSFNKALEAFDFKALPSNDLLGVFYLLAIGKINKNIKLKTIKRMNSSFISKDLEANSNITSASSIRENITKSKDYLPEYSWMLLSKNRLDEEKLLPFIKYSILNSRVLGHLIESNEGIHNRLESILSVNTIGDALETLRTKRYSNSKNKRLLINVLLNLTKDDYINSAEAFNFIRVLGYSAVGKDYLNKLKKAVPVYTNIKNNINKTLDCEIKITKVLDLIFNNNLFSLEQKGPYKK